MTKKPVCDYDVLCAEPRTKVRVHCIRRMPLDAFFEPGLDAKELAFLVKHGVSFFASEPLKDKRADQFVRARGIDAVSRDFQNFWRNINRINRDTKIWPRPPDGPYNRIHLGAIAAREHCQLQSRVQGQCIT